MAATVWKGYISFGLVSFPVRLFSAARAETIHFHMLHKKDQSRVKEVWYCTEEDKPIKRSDIEKGYEVSKGKYVVVGDEELKKIAPPTATTMDVLQFVGSDEVDPIYFESSYYLAAEDKTAKPYVLFMAALTEHEAGCNCENCHAQSGARCSNPALPRWPGTPYAVLPRRIASEPPYRGAEGKVFRQGTRPCPQPREPSEGAL